MVAAQTHATNTRMPGGQRAAPNCRSFHRKRLVSALRWHEPKL